MAFVLFLDYHDLKIATFGLCLGATDCDDIHEVFGKFVSCDWNLVSRKYLELLSFAYGKPVPVIVCVPSQVYDCSSLFQYYWALKVTFKFGWTSVESSLNEL